MEQEIFDRDKGKWFRLERHWPRGLQLVEQKYEGVRKFPTGGEVAYSDCKGLHIMPEPKRPPTPQPNTHNLNLR